MDAAFAAVADIHRLMSFHDPDSELSRLNREAARRPVSVHPHTYAVLTLAQDVARASGGAFDVTVGGRLAAWGRLPAPDGPKPDPGASWRDIELLGEGRVRFHHRLWIDLGGIAKGYAVDRAIEAIDIGDAGLAIVNAGGDLRVQGRGAEWVALRTERFDGEGVPAVELEDASLASSTGRGHAGRSGGEITGPHIDARRGKAVGARRFVSVVARECAVADALTKVVLARGAGANACLARFGATAFLDNARGAWTTLGETS